VLLTAVAYGSIADSIDDFVRDNKALADMFTSGGGASLTQSYLATSLRIVALLGAGFAIQSALRLRSEETLLHAEPLLATPVSRRRWAMSHLLVACGGCVVLLTLSGLGVGLSYGLVGGGIGVVPGLLADALAYVPAMWLTVGITFALIGLLPRLVILTWVFLAVCFVIGLLGGLLDLPGWLMDVSPFDQVPLVPAATFRVVPLVVLGVVAFGLCWAGLIGLRRRDIG
jgi:ABC-2 type transport system permease protein